MCRHKLRQSLTIGRLWWSPVPTMVRSSKLNFCFSHMCPPAPHYAGISLGYIITQSRITGSDMWPNVPQKNQCGIFRVTVQRIQHSLTSYRCSFFVLILYYEKFQTCRKVEIISQRTLTTQIPPLTFHSTFFMPYPPIQTSS